MPILDPGRPTYGTRKRLPLSLASRTGSRRVKMLANITDIRYSLTRVLSTPDIKCRFFFTLACLPRVWYVNIAKGNVNKKVTHHNSPKSPPWLRILSAVFGSICVGQYRGEPRPRTYRGNILQRAHPASFPGFVFRGTRK